MRAENSSLTDQRLRSPRAAAAAGIAFAVLYSISIILIRIAVAGATLGEDTWIISQSRQIKFAFSLVPFSGIAFLWFLGVMRERIGHQEDQLFATLFLGSGLLYLAMTFAGSALAGGLIAGYAADPQRIAGSAAATITLATTQTFNNVYAVRMAGMLMLILGTIWTQTGVMPRWLILITYLGAFALLISIGFTAWAVLVFPAWVLLVSIYILIQNFGHYGDDDAGSKP